MPLKLLWNPSGQFLSLWMSLVSWALMQKCFSNFAWSQSSFGGQAVLIDHHNTRHLSQRSARDPGHCSRNKLVIILITRRMQPLTRPGCLSQERARKGWGDPGPDRGWWHRVIKTVSSDQWDLVATLRAEYFSSFASDYLHKMTGPFPVLFSWLSQIFRFLSLSASDCFWMTRHLGGCCDNEQNSVTPLSWRGCKVTCPGCICVAIKILSIVSCGWPASAGEGGGMRWLGFSLCFPIVSELSVSVYRSIYDNTDNRVYQWHHLW